MSGSKSRWRLRTVGAGSAGVAGVWLWWQASLRDPRSAPSMVARDVWPWAKWLLVVAGTAVLAGMLWRAFSGRSPARMTGRAGRRAQRHAGFASWWDLLWHTGWLALRRQAPVVRPRLVGESWRRRWTTPLRELGFRLCRVGRQWAYSSVEEATLRIAPPRTGKTVEMSNLIIDAPGAVVATSTRADILRHTVRLRARLGRPIHVFNPDGVGGWDLVSTFRWNPLVGCDNPTVAIRRAGYLLSGSPQMSDVASREFWEGQAVRVLAAMLHAAALGRRTLLEVRRWVSSPDSSSAQVLALLARSPAGRTCQDDYQQFLETPDKTRGSITTAITPALAWLSDPAVAATVLVGEDEQFDVDEFLHECGTLYLLGSDRPHGTVAPLFTALTAELFERAKLIASQSPGDRLDPPLTMVLDEAPLICPVPLPQWTSEGGGWGIPIHIGAQSLAWLRRKWGTSGAEIIWTNTTAKMIYGGIDVPEDLRALSELCGERDERVESIGPDGRITSSMRRVRVMSPAQIRLLPQWRVLLMRRYMRPTIGRIRPVFRRWDVRLARWSNRNVEAAIAGSVAPVSPGAGPVADVPRPRPAQAPVAAPVGE